MSIKLSSDRRSLLRSLLLNPNPTTSFVSPKSRDRLPGSTTGTSEDKRRKMPTRRRKERAAGSLNRQRLTRLPLLDLQKRNYATACALLARIEPRIETRNAVANSQRSRAEKRLTLSVKTSPSPTGLIRQPPPPPPGRRPRRRGNPPHPDGHRPSTCLLKIARSSTSSGRKLPPPRRHQTVVPPRRPIIVSHPRKYTMRR